MTSLPLLDRRKTRQKLPPLKLEPTAEDAYDLYPAMAVPTGSIGRGYRAIAEKLIGCQSIRVDGYVGVFWDEFTDRLQAAFAGLGVESTWVDVSRALKDQCEIDELARPYLGGDDPLFGTRYGGQLSDLFDTERLRSLWQDASGDCVIFYGCGAGLIASDEFPVDESLFDEFPVDGPLVYVDLPKNELQFRSRAGAIGNLGMSSPLDPKATYKRFYFFDWPILNRHKAAIVHQVDWFVDQQRPDQPAMISGDTLRKAFDQLSHGVFRVRPWFEPGPWGGQWIKQLVAELPQDVPNYAWSFELITPENGLMFTDGSHLLEVSFDWAMYHNAEEILGDSRDRFGYDFPIRFNFLDTFEGGNLSIQCHPRTEYIQAEFGEPFTQDECYYIVDCLPGAEVHLGFVDDIDPAEFGAELKRSFAAGTKLDVKRYINTLPTHQHDLFLIPGGTVHSSGVNNLVLEISATTYIFTFKMYDWQRMDLDGTPRPLNIDRALENLHFDRKGARIAKEFVSQPVELSRGGDWRLIHLPTHCEQFYDVHRFEFDTEVSCSTDGSPHVMALVEGSSVIVETKSGMRRQFSYAETFVVAAAAESYRLINLGKQPAKVVKAFIKPMPQANAIK